MSLNPKYRNAGLSSYYASFRADDTLISILPAFDFQSNENDIPNCLFQSTLHSTNFGPFKAGMEAIVPLWMAVVLQQRSFAQIVLPEWLAAPNLTHIIQYEKSHALLFPTSSSNSKSKSKEKGMVEDLDDEEDRTIGSSSDPQHSHFLPENYYEVALRLMSAFKSSSSHATPDTPYSVLSLLVQDLFEIRVDKLRQQFQSLMEETVRRNLGTADELSLAAFDLIINVTGIGTQELTSIQPYVQQAMQDIYALASSEKASSQTRVPTSAGTDDADTNTPNAVSQRRTSLLKRRLQR